MENTKMTVKKETKQVKHEKPQEAMSENKTMKKKKRKIYSNTDVDPEAEEVYQKKKKPVKTNKPTITADVLLEEEPVKDKKKKKNKNKSLQTESNVEIVKIEQVELNDIDNGKNKPKKSKKQKNQTEVADCHTNNKKDKRNKEFTEEEILILETVTTKKKKKKKSKILEKEIECSQEGHIVNDKIVKETKSKAKENSLNSEDQEIDVKDFKQVKKKKHKKNKSETEMGLVPDIKKCKKAEDISNLSDKLELKKKKKKKTAGENDKEPLMMDSESDTTSKRKQKKRSKEGEIKIDLGADTGPKKKKKKIKEELPEQELVQEPSQADVVFLSEKTGNTDEVNINKERRRALQKEIDKASQPQKPAKPLGLGQWGTAEFGSSEQQQKFLRLMGGLKKGFQPASSSGAGGNMALGKEAQQQLQQGLLGEFERAHSRRMDLNNRGAGIGFTAPSKKKFSIDANMTRSIRFDD